MPYASSCPQNPLLVVTSDHAACALRCIASLVDEQLAVDENLVDARRVADVALAAAGQVLDEDLGAAIDRVGIEDDVLTMLDPT